MIVQKLGIRRGGAALVCAAVAVSSCSTDEPDAYGNFEATEVVVSAEVGGQLMQFAAREGDRIGAGVTVGLLDTTQAGLQLAELRAQRSSAQAQTGQAQAQTGALQAQLSSAEREYARTRRLFDDEAATAQQLDLARSQVDVLREQIRAARAQTTGARGQTDVTDARIAQLQDRVDRSHIRSPITGTVLASYANAGEFIQTGQRLFRIADLDTLVLRAYVDGGQLGQLRLGQRVQVTFDAAAGERTTVPGTVTWIAATAEFTPTPIQTRDERADLVYAVKVRVPNPDGVLRIGMPGELQLREQVVAQRPEGR